MRNVLLLFFGLTCCWVSAHSQKDSVYLYNGQVLIGEVQGASLGAISIDDLDLKILSVKLYKIRRLRIYQLYKIELLDKRQFSGLLETPEKEATITIIPEQGPRLTVSIVSIHQLTPLNKEFFKRLDGNLSAGLSYSKSSAIGQVNFSTSVGFATRLFDYQLQASEIGSIDSGKFSRDNENLQVFAAYDMRKAWFLAGLAGYQRNLELSIARRWIEMLGAGNKLIVRNDWQLMAISGLSFDQERSTEGVSSPILLEIPVMLRFNFYKFHHPNIQISSMQTAYFSVTEKGRFRYDGSTDFSWELIRYFYLKINPYSSYDSKPPSGGTHTFDFGVAMSVSYKF